MTVKSGGEAEIRALIDQWTRAIRDKDADGVMAHYAPGSVTFDLAPPLKSAGADAKGLRAWFATWRGGPATRSATSPSSRALTRRSATASTD